MLHIDDLSEEESNLMRKLNTLTFKAEHLKEKFKIEDDEILINNLQYLKNKERIHRETKRKNESAKVQRNIKSAIGKREMCSRQYSIK